MTTFTARLHALVSIATLAAFGCAGEAPPPTVAPTPAAAATAAGTASEAPSAAPSPSAAPAPTASAAAQTPSAPRAPTVAEIMASVPEKAGTIKLDRGLQITIDGKDRVVIDDPKGHLGGTSHCGANGFVYRKSVQLFAELQEAVRAGAREKVSALVLYPLRINDAPGKPIMVSDRSTLERDFDKVFTEKVVSQILAAEPRAVFCRSDGFMLGSGVVWAATKQGKYGIFVVNH